MSTHTEVAITAMVTLPNGDMVAWEAVRFAPGAPAPQTWDVEVRRFHSSGDVDILEEHEDLQEDEAKHVFERLCAKYPDADHSVNY